ncbi:hypothetical protein KSP40_PGU022289 [Platanthera guangdongensis]|uniref:Aldehyde dehydrogenase domain-containing protein n=1 Tax=Platanthera guangdongensis TaxID=2320717 RepID=A0ABR2MP33_9ASPA
MRVGRLLCPHSASGLGRPPSPTLDLIMAKQFAYENRTPIELTSAASLAHPVPPAKELETHQSYYRIEGAGLDPSSQRIVHEDIHNIFTKESRQDGQRISLAKSACTLALKELQQWMKPEKVSSMLTAFPSSAEIVPEPLGLVLVISAWNYPFRTSTIA